MLFTILFVVVLFLLQIALYAWWQNSEVDAVLFVDSALHLHSTLSCTFKHSTARDVPPSAPAPPAPMPPPFDAPSPSSVPLNSYGDPYALPPDVQRMRDIVLGLQSAAIRSGPPPSSPSNFSQTFIPGTQPLNYSPVPSTQPLPIDVVRALLGTALHAPADPPFPDSNTPTHHRSTSTSSGPFSPRLDLSSHGQPRPVLTSPASGLVSPNNPRTRLNFMADAPTSSAPFIPLHPGSNRVGARFRPTRTAGTYPASTVQRDPARFVNNPCPLPGEPCNVDGKHRFWMVTQNNPSRYCPEGLEHYLEQAGNVQWCVWQLELGDSGTLHWQIYLELKRPMTRSAARLVLPHGCWLVRRGTQSQAVNYCTKDDETKIDGAWDWGEFKAAAQGE